jgi:protein-S-isoprenylcysteine O-methyltransferase Ste14
VIQRLRVPLGFVIAAIVLWIAAPSGRTILAGLPIALFGAAFRAMAAGVIRKDSRLATSGPYSWTRNPLYFGSFLMSAGFAIMSANWIAACALMLPSIVVYPTVIQSEEGHLRRLFPDEYREYCARVPRFVPSFRRIEWFFSFSQYIANREYNTALGFTATLVILIVKWRLI